MTRAGSAEDSQFQGFGPEAITEEVVARFSGTPDERLRFLVQHLTRHLHQFAIETGLTLQEWIAGVEFLTAVGQRCAPTRQEMILLSDTLGLSMVVDAVAHSGAENVTPSTVLGPFYVPDSPERPMGSSIVEMDGSGEPVLVSGTVRGTDGEAIEGAVLDVWQNAANGMYAVQDSGQPESNLRGRFVTGPDGRFSFWSVRPTEYAIPDDGPVGAMLRATGRHPWRPAHIHVIVSAPGLVAVTTHLFDDESAYLDSDAVFGVKPSLICRFEPHGAEVPGAPEGSSGRWYTLERDIVLAPLM
jgi:protocatechuate 3,4-dioxygenase beta subunit